MKLFNFIKYVYTILVLAIFSSSVFAIELQVHGAYGYDLNANSLIVEQADVRYEKYVYGEGCNFIHCGVEQSLKSHSEKVKAGPFFSFEVGLVATKGIPSALNIGGKQFSKKLNRRAKELNLDVSNPQVRFKFKDRIQRVFNNADEVRKGGF
jgi:hypothetical protein